MARQLLQQCLECQAWALTTTCTKCGGKAQAAAPLKWSPEDHQADIRRRLHNVESDEWPSTLPTIPDLEAPCLDEEE